MIAVLDYGMGNLRSVARALERVGGRVTVTGEPAVAGRAAALVVPGSGPSTPACATCGPRGWTS